MNDAASALELLVFLGREAAPKPTPKKDLPPALLVVLQTALQLKRWWREGHALDDLTPEGRAAAAKAAAEMGEIIDALRKAAGGPNGCHKPAVTSRARR
jgi:hypothetical protein